MILLVLIPLLYILTVDEREVFETRDFVEDNKTWNAAERAIMKMSYWNSSFYEGINLMDLVSCLVTSGKHVHVIYTPLYPTFI